MPKLLFLSQVLPYPPDTGVAVRTYNILRLLAQDFDITFIGFYRAKAHRSAIDRADSVRTLATLARVSVHPIPQEHSRRRMVTDHLSSLIRGVAYTHYAYRSSSFQEALRSAIASECFDLVHVDSLDLFRYLPLLGQKRVVCVHHNVESELLLRRAAVEKHLVKRLYLRRQARLLEQVERRWCPAVSLNVVVSDADRVALQARAPTARFLVVPNGVDIVEFTPAGEPSDGSLVFLGGTEWFPNLDALHYLGESILPLMRQRGIKGPIIGVGRATPEHQRFFAARYGINLTGYVQDVRPYLARAACILVPLRVGGGTRLKITTSWAMGCAVVSTPLGCEGLDARDGENLLIRDTPEGFADAVATIVSDPELKVRLGVNGRRTAEELYSWEVIGRPMLEKYRTVCSSVPIVDSSDTSVSSS